MKKFAIFALLVAPSIAFAAGAPLSGLQTLLTNFGKLVDTALPIIVSLALLAFFWGLVKFIWGGGDKEKAKSLMGWSILALFLMVSIWGIVRFIAGSVGIDQNADAGTIDVPTVKKN